MAFDGGSYYRSTSLDAFVANLDQANYSISFDTYCTALGRRIQLPDVIWKERRRFVHC